MQKLHYVAEAHTDFIFSIIGEELGFLGCAAVVCAFMGLVVHGRRIAWSARAWSPQDPFPFYVAAGATFLITFQALVNLAVVTGSAPTKGVSMPFISVGGSNLLVMATCVGLLVNVARASAALALDAPRR
ncbi:MAG: FtsW/RodA/SpoVE family cell cycle protein [Planctomycetota bacterium]